MRVTSRRRFLLKSSAALALSPAWLSGLTGCAATASPSRLTTADDVLWLNRLTWGIDSAALERWHRASMREALREHLQPSGTAALPAEAQAQIDAMDLSRQSAVAWAQALDRQRRDTDATTDPEAQQAARKATRQQAEKLAREAGSRFLLRALYSPHQLQEQLTWFWFNHFNIYERKGQLGVMVGDYEQRLRTHALGRFRDLLVASATHAAMLRYLDNEQNAAKRLNENLARELMELHTLGVDGGYTQADVQELARVLTGLGVSLSDEPPKVRPALQGLVVRDGLTEFNPARHDMGDKRVLGVTVTGRGIPEILEQLDRLARHPSTARHVSRKLAMYLVADEPSPALVDRMARTFERSEGQITAVLQTMFEAPEFTPSLGRKFKDPLHYVVSAVRLAYDGRFIRNTAPMQQWLNRLGQGLYLRQTPDGYPLDAAPWSGSGSMTTRFEIARTLGVNSAGLFRGEGMAADVPAFPQLSNALYHQAVSRTLSDRTRAALDAAASPQEWNALLLSSPEFMMR